MFHLLNGLAFVPIINPPKSRASSPVNDITTQKQNMKNKKTVKKLIIFEEIGKHLKMLYLLVLEIEEIIC